MKKVLIVCNAVAGAVVLTVGFAVATLLFLAFSSDDDTVSRTAFFGSLSFDSVEQSDGSIGVTAGVDDPIPLIVLGVVLAVTLVMIQLTYLVLRRYREDLIAERDAER